MVVEMGDACGLASPIKLSRTLETYRVRLPQKSS
jgi:hypothetical protein